MTDCLTFLVSRDHWVKRKVVRACVTAVGETALLKALQNSAVSVAWPSSGAAGKAGGANKYTENEDKSVCTLLKVDEFVQNASRKCKTIWGIFISIWGIFVSRQLRRRI
jgi:hypothetical protein